VSLWKWSVGVSLQVHVLLTVVSVVLFLAQNSSISRKESQKVSFVSLVSLNTTTESLMYEIIAFPWKKTKHDQQTKTHLIELHSCITFVMK
jgi:hypothetical protein